MVVVEEGAVSVPVLNELHLRPQMVKNHNLQLQRGRTTTENLILMGKQMERRTMIHGAWMIMRNHSSSKYKLKIFHRFFGLYVFWRCIQC